MISINRNIAIVIVILVLVVIAGYLVWIRSKYQPPATPDVEVEEVVPTPTEESTPSGEEEATSPAEEATPGTEAR